MVRRSTDLDDIQEQSLKEVKPFGWKLGLTNQRFRQTNEIELQKKTNNEEKHHRKSQNLLKQGYEKLLSDPFHRTQYQSYKQMNG